MAKQFRDPSGWDRLSPGYRARLEGRGFTRYRYSHTKSLAAARGHKGTPERPERALRGPTGRGYGKRYDAYIKKQAAAGRPGFRPPGDILPPGEYRPYPPAELGVPPLEAGQTISDPHGYLGKDGKYYVTFTVTDWRTGEEHQVRRRLTAPEIRQFAQWLRSMGYDYIAVEYEGVK